MVLWLSLLLLDFFTALYISVYSPPEESMMIFFSRLLAETYKLDNQFMGCDME